VIGDVLPVWFEHHVVGHVGEGNLVDTINVPRYHLSMIRSFAARETERLFRRQLSRKLPHDIQRRARVKLEILDAAESLEDLRIPPSNRLEKLSGDRDGQHSIRINNQWRICFEWREGDAYQVEIVDYH
jgi:proteic killer suppression protein